MKQKNVILWLFVGFPLICIAVFLIFLGYLSTQPKTQTALGQRLYKNGDYTAAA